MECYNSGNNLSISYSIRDLRMTLLSLFYLLNSEETRVERSLLRPRKVGYKVNFLKEELVLLRNPLISFD